jgi:phospholipid/cholesterol/gamma-HCH transport system permease protein
MARIASLPAGFVADVGRRFLASASVALRVSSLPYASIKGIWLERARARRIVLRTTAHQVYFTAVQPLPLFLFLALLSGVVVIAGADKLLARVGLAPYLPAVVVVSLVRELGPLVLALVLTGRTGPAVTTELGYMKVNHEIEALESLGINLDYFVVLPRLVGITVASASLTVVTSAMALVGGFYTAHAFGMLSASVDPHLILAAIELPTTMVALTKSVAFGAIVATVCCHYGLSVGSSHTNIPRANVRAAVVCYVLCFSLDALLSLLATRWGS